MTDFTSSDPFPGGQGRGVCWSPERSRFVAVGLDADATVSIATSPDGQAWTPRGQPFPGDSFGSGVCWSPDLGLFIAVGGGQIFSSANGADWDLRSNPFGGAVQDILDVCWSPELGLFVAVGTNGLTTTKQVITSSNGTSWTVNAAAGPLRATSGTIFGVCWSPELGLFCCVGSSNDHSKTVATSPDGTTWTAHGNPFGTSAIGNHVCWSPELGLFLAVAAGGTPNLITSATGSAWDAATGVSSGSVMLGCSWSPERAEFVAAGWHGSDSLLLSSPDGAAFTSLGDDPFTDGLAAAVCWSPEILSYVAVGQSA